MRTTTGEKNLKGKHSGA